MFSERKEIMCFYWICNSISLSLALFSSSKLLREKEKQITLYVPFVGHKIGSTLALHIHFASILILHFLPIIMHLENYVLKNGLHYRIKE